MRLRISPHLRRRIAALSAAVLVTGLVVLAGPWQAWPLLALPMVVAMPLAGGAGLAGVAVAVALILSLVTGRAGPVGTELAVGYAAFLGLAVAVGVGATQRDREVARAQSASFSDRLTGLANFAYFSDALRRECLRADRYGGALSLVLLDLDGFKAFNDRYGHEAGNRLLAAVGRVIDVSRRSADLAARYGGEEFALLVYGTRDDAILVAERVRGAVEHVAVPVGAGRADGVTISAGIASYAPGGGSGAALIEGADRALYAAKRGGRNQVSTAGEAPRRVGVAA